MDLLRDLEALLQLRCSLGELPAQLNALNLGWLAPEVRKELEELSELTGEEDVILSFDLSVINDIHYYNGIVFQGFVRGIAEKVLSGGRYDSLLERMQRKGSAVGFAIYFGVLEQILRRAETWDADLLLLYDENTPLTQVRDLVEKNLCEGRSVSAQRCADGGRYRETLDIRGGKRDA